MACFQVSMIVSKLAIQSSGSRNDFHVALLKNPLQSPAENARKASMFGR